MNKIKTFFRRIRFRLKHDFLTVENMILIFAIALCAVWTYQSVVAMSRNWELSERLAAERKELDLAKVEVETMEFENEYYKSDEYQEILARKYLDKMTSGEQMVVMPENTEEAKNRFNNTVVLAKEKEYSNFDKWMMFLFPGH
ncbi:hypothetical protein J5491_03220 [Candidatus Saccharibacteria bacterium]|nr:hypothetical protein [Candidatus Saccharibacteria bacterium]